MALRMCPKCDYQMPLREAMENLMIRQCRNCGQEEEEQKGLVMETVIQQQSSDSQKTFVNEYTKTDPRLPHVKNLKCPNESCGSRTGKQEADVIQIKQDTANMKFLQICSICDTQWRSRS